MLAKRNDPDIFTSESLCFIHLLFNFLSYAMVCGVTFSDLSKIGENTPTSRNVKGVAQ